jgi:3',5'-cyclic AMP phosphodiesterase CpdA
MFVLAHLSDPHLGPLPTPSLSNLVSKRLLGFVNWHLRRGRQHRLDVLAMLVDDLTAAAPDHVAVTGDLVNIALEAEYIRARAWLGGLGTPDHVTLVPGNHDIYVRATAQHARRFWDPYMRGDANAAPPSLEPFPFVRRRGPVALIGVSSALPTFPLLATGKVTPDQLQRLMAVLEQLKRQQVFRVVLIHHPPAGAEHWQKRLVDAAAFRHIVQEYGADLILHGHDHIHQVAWIEGPTGPIPVVGVPSASMALGGPDDPAAYHLFGIDGAPGAWRCEMLTRGVSAGHPGIVERGRRILVG